MTARDEGMTLHDKRRISRRKAGRPSPHDAIFPILPFAGVIAFAREQNWSEVGGWFPSLLAERPAGDRRCSYAEGREGLLRAQHRARGLQLAVHSGARKALPHMGALGPGLAAHRLLGDALQFGLTYQRVAGCMLDLRLQQTADQAWLAAYPLFDDPELQRFLDIDHLSTVANALRQLQPNGPPLFERVELGFEANGLHDALERLFEVPVACGRPISRLLLRGDALQRTQLLYSALNIDLSRQACERELAIACLSSDGGSSLRGHLYDACGRLRPLADVANTLAISLRTLHRSMASEGIRYSQLLDEQRQNEAMGLLLRGHATAAVAEKLDFSDSRSFVRAFERWTGKSPAAWCREQHSALRRAG
ncbi:helix-turn-helix transcriptional regulator [Pseudoxanthomonas dokdonensis]|uniref:HTH araC/xylS-type domain-containing protein n=1 Tax=Pseudoxanthomonas dokdonensis TaxID=344882 RepID=A0A0R0CEZ0_9GAMM|nr:helix-turn-helix domain-containing protein [Pseudoxanthomonas dokdonensis]KRG68345.1 hypothetical protein ABB29_13580 [Pseudoxanthomonas dokdonensis]